MELQKLIDIVDAREQEYAARRHRIMQAWNDANSDIPMTVDRHGRFHAPCDGYMLPVEYNDGMCDTVYGKGEFLPMPFDPDADYFLSAKWSADHKTKVKAFASDIEAVKVFITENKIPAEVAAGKPWTVESKMVAYAYITAQWKSLADAIGQLLDRAFKPIMQAIQPEVYLEGKHTIVGKVVCIKVQGGYYGTQVKMLVLTEKGHKLWGSVTSSINDVDVGQTVTFSATFEKGSNGMSWFKRPTKAKIL